MSDFETLENDLGDKYHNFQEIGLGSFATVFHAESKLLNKNVAIKMINKTGLQEEIIEYLNQEIEILKKCHHDNIIKFYDQSETNDTIYIVLEECKMDLAMLWEDYFNQKMPEKYVIFIVLQLIEGFKQLHQQLIIHRDIKLENILVQIPEHSITQLKNQQFDALFQASFKISDMGISKQLASQTDLASTYAGSSMTMAPEILASEQYGVQADIFSLGVIMFQLLFGKFPFGNDKNHLEDIKNQNIQFDDQQISGGMKQILKSLLKFEPSQRLNWLQLQKSLQVLLQEDKIMFEFDDSEEEQDQEFEVINLESSAEDRLIEEFYNQRTQYLLLAKAYQQIYQQDVIDQFYDYEQYQRCAENIYLQLRGQLDHQEFGNLPACKYLRELVNNEDKQLFLGSEIVQEYKSESIFGLIKQSIFGSPVKKSIETQLKDIRQLNFDLIQSLKDIERDSKQQYLLIALLQLEIFFKKQIKEQEQLDYSLFNIDLEEVEPQRLQNLLEQIFTNILI